MSDKSNYTKLNALKKIDPNTYSVLQKLVRDPTGDTSAFKQDFSTMADINLLRKISGLTGANISDAKSIFQLIPEINICAQILISSVTSPKDITTGHVNYDSSINDANPTMVGECVQYISGHLTNEFKLNNRIYDMVWETVITHGSYPMAIIPESSIDALINSHERVTTESANFKEVFTDKGELKGKGYFSSPITQTRVMTTLESMNIHVDSATNYFGSLNFYDNLTNLESFSISLPNPEINKEEDRIEIDSGKFKETMKKLLGTITLVDNVDMLKMPELHERMKHQFIQERNDRVLNESIENLLEEEGDTILPREEGTLNQESADANRQTVKLRPEELYPNRRYKVEPFTELKTMDKVKRKTIGHPSVRRCASRAIIPLSKPGEPKVHQGYLALVDETGYLISEAPASDYYTDFYQNQVMNNQQVEQMQLGNFNGGSGRFSTAMLVEAEIKALNHNYRRQLEKNIIQSVENGLNGKTVELNSVDEWCDVAFARSLAGKRTQVLYIPKEQMTYFAVDYNNYGIGTSILDDARILSACRIMISFANVMRTLDNAIGRETVTIRLDPKDQNPRKTVTNTWHEVLRTRLTNVLPITETSPVGAVRYLSSAGISLQVEGNERFPSMGIDKTPRESTLNRIDTDFDEALARRQINMFGLTPDTVDAALSQADFATSVKNNSLSLTKRVVMIQQPFNEHLTDFAKKYTSQSGILVGGLAKIIAKYVKDLPEEYMTRLGISKETKPATFIQRVIKDVIASIQLSLPAPETVIMENQITELETYQKGVELVINNMVNEDTIKGFDIGDVAGSDGDGDKVKMVRAAFITHFMRQEMQKKNFMPEIFKLIRLNDTGRTEKDIISYHTEHVKMMGDLIEQYVKDTSLMREKRDKRMADWAEKKNVDLEQDTSGGFGGGDTGTEGGGDDLGLGGGEEDDDLSLDDNLDEESPDAESEDDTEKKESEKETEENKGNEEDASTEGEKEKE